MKFVVCLVLCCLSVINARYLNIEHSFGDVIHGEIFGLEHISAEMPTTSHTEYTQFELTFPSVSHILVFVRTHEYETHWIIFYLEQVPTNLTITGIKYIDHHPETKVEFVNGKIGDHQMTIKVVALNHDIDSTFIFYTKKWKIMYFY